MRGSTAHNWDANVPARSTSGANPTLVRPPVDWAIWNNGAMSENHNGSTNPPTLQERVTRARAALSAVTVMVTTAVILAVVVVAISAWWFIAVRSDCVTPHWACPVTLDQLNADVESVGGDQPTVDVLLAAVADDRQRLEGYAVGLLTVAAAIAALVVTGSRAYSASVQAAAQQAAIAQQTRSIDQQSLTLGMRRHEQQDDRYTRAINQIAADQSIEVRIGGLFALEKLTLEDDLEGVSRYTAVVYEVLVAYVREHTRPDYKSEEYTQWVHETDTDDPEHDRFVPPVIGTDVETVLKILSRQRQRFDQHVPKLSASSGQEQMDAPLGSTPTVGIHLVGETLTEAWLTGADLSRATLTNTNFNGATLTHMYFNGATLTHMYFNGATLTNTDFHDATLTNTNFMDATLTNTGFYRATLINTRFNGATFTNTNFMDATLTKTGFYRATMTATGFYGATMTATRFDATTLVDTDFEEATLTDSRFLTATLTDSRFRTATLTGTRFSKTTLTDTDFEEATLTDTRFDTATLTGLLLWGGSWWDPLHAPTWPDGLDAPDNSLWLLLDLLMQQAILAP